MGLFNNSQFPYTNFHEMNLDWIAEKMNEAAGIADGLADRVTAAEGDIDALETRATNDERDITNLATRTTTAEGDIDTLEIRMGTAEANITTNANDIDTVESRMGTAEGDIDALETRMGAAEDDIDALETRMDTAEDDIDALETRMTTAETDIDTKTTTRVTQGTLDSGVLVGTIYVDNNPTRLYAPTAGSTVVRAIDVPFNNTPTNPPMTATTVQEALEELNTNIDNQIDNVETIINNLNSENIANTISDIATRNAVSYPNDCDPISGTYNANTFGDCEKSQHKIINDIFAVLTWVRDNFVCGNNLGSRNEVEIYGQPYSGHITGGAQDIYVFIPYDKMIEMYYGHNYSNTALPLGPQTTMNPKTTPNVYRFSMSGTITVRGVNGYILNNINLGDSSIDTINVYARGTGYTVQIHLADPVSSSIATNNTPVTVWFGSNSKLAWQYST